MSHKGSKLKASLFLSVCTACLFIFLSPALAAMFKIHHMGIIVKDMDQAVQIYCDIAGVDKDDSRIEKFQGKENKTTMVPLGKKDDHAYLELMQSNSSKWIENYFKSDLAAGWLHMAVLVDNFDEKIKELREKGFTVHVEETPHPFEGCDLLREAYVMPKEASPKILIDLIDAVHFPKDKGGLAP